MTGWIATELTGRVWRWRSFAGSEPVQVANPGRYTLEFHDGGRYAVRADCNNGSGTYELDGDRLTLSPGAMTLAACGPDSLDQRFLELLSAVRGYSPDGNRLTLALERGAGAMEFEAAKDLTLAGTSWLVRGYNNGKQAVVSVNRSTRLTLEIGPGGRLSGSAGCNRYSADYTVLDHSFTIGPAVTTRKACPDPVMEQEAAYLAALGMVARYRVLGERLQLRTEKGSMAVELVAAVTGELTYRVRKALPPEAVVTVQLLDTSKADRLAEVLAQQVFTPTGKQVPLPFEVTYDPAKIDARNSYSIGATIADPDGTLLFRTTKDYPVVTQDKPSYDVQLVLEPGSDCEISQI